MEGRPRSAVRPSSAVAAVSMSTEFLERGAMVGAGQYGVAKNPSFGANALANLVLPEQPASTSPLTSSAPPTPGPPTATTADLRAMVAALDESRDLPSVSPAPSPGPTAPTSPARPSGHASDPSIPQSVGLIRSNSPNLDLEPAPGSLKLFCSGGGGRIVRSSSPGPGAGPRGSVTLFPGSNATEGLSANTPSARHGVKGSTLSVDVYAPSTTAASSHSSTVSPTRPQGWIESVYSPKSPAAAASGVGSGAGLGVGPAGPDGIPAHSSPMGSPGRHRGPGTPRVGSPSSPNRGGMGRAMTPLQYLYGPAPQPPPVVIVASATAESSSSMGRHGSADGATAANGGSPGGDAGASDPPLANEGLRAYYVLSPQSPSAMVPKVNSLQSSPKTGAERSGSPSRAGPVGAKATPHYPSPSAYLKAATGPVRQPGMPTLGQASRYDVDADALSSIGSPRGSRQALAPSPSRSEGGPSECSVAPGPGPGSAALAGGRTSPAAGRSAAGAGAGRGRSGAAPRSQASVGSVGSPRAQHPGTARRIRREELFEEEDPAVVLEQSIALLTEIEAHIRESVGLQPDHPLQSIDPDLAQDIPMQLVEALEGTLEVISMAREELAARKAHHRVSDREREQDRGRDGDRGPRQAWHGAGRSAAPYGQYRSSGGGSANGRLPRSGSQPGYAPGSGTGAGSGRVSRGSWAGSAGGGGGSPGSQLPPIGGSSGGGAGGRSGAPLYGRPPSQQHPSRPSSQQQQQQQQPPHSQLPRSGSSGRQTSGYISGGGGAGGSSGGGGSVTSIPSLAATISSRRPWHREPPPEEWLAAKQARADLERRKREAQLAADLRYLQQIRSRAAEVQQTHEALLAQAEESVRAARHAKSSTEAQHRWLQYQDTVTEGAKRHYETLMSRQQVPIPHEGAYGAAPYRVY